MRQSRRAAVGVLWGVLLLCVAALGVAADQVEMQNGDRYAGKVLSLSSNTVVLESPVLGTVRLPRDQVAHLTVGTGMETNAAGLRAPGERQAGEASVAVTNARPELSAPLGQLGASSNLIEQVQRQFLGDAGPEATAKYNELLGGLMNGKLTVSDIRVEAQNAADQLRALKRELGNDAGGAVDSYLSILDHFLKETAPPAGSATNALASPATSGLAPKHE